MVTLSRTKGAPTLEASEPTVGERLATAQAGLQRLGVESNQLATVRSDLEQAIAKSDERRRSLLFSQDVQGLDQSAALEALATDRARLVAQLTDAKASQAEIAERQTAVRAEVTRLEIDLQITELFALAPAIAQANKRYRDAAQELFQAAFAHATLEGEFKRRYGKLFELGREVQAPVRPSRRLVGADVDQVMRVYSAEGVAQASIAAARTIMDPTQ